MLALALAVGPAGCIRRSATHAEVARARAGVAALRDAAQAFVQKNHRCPTEQEVPRGADPWGHAYVLLCPGQKGHAVDVVSKGADGELATEDDVRSWD